MKLNGNTSKRSAAARREAADFAAQERSPKIPTLWTVRLKAP